MADQFSSSKDHDEARPILLYQVLLFQLPHSGLTEQCPNKAPNAKLVNKKHLKNILVTFNAFSKAERWRLEKKVAQAK